eukprot:Gregarina_sp_Pseudo_9__798@NODE_150_length_3952_cov_42_171224_g137_i0_p1_GENE_NODE_150_length_3952_cov_42_171224_g137_i0NODE_150_length_3952_cov_42_171224_g137_i0_p1_ORF_typecomplete_len716_score173_58_NODE_150_length_3952_cov_42_171224_g137_i016183765
MDHFNRGPPMDPMMLNSGMANPMSAPQQYMPLSTKDDLLTTEGGEVDYDPDDFVENTLYRGRKRTDRRISLLFTSCLTLFIAIIAKLLVTNASYIGSLGRPRNYQGLACGYDSSVASLPFLFVPLDPADGKALRLLPSRALCVSRCPDQTDVGAKAFLDIPEVSLMQDKGKAAMMSLLHSVRSPVYASKPFAGVFCLPEHKVLMTQVHDVFDSHLALFGTRLLAGGLWISAPLAVGALLLSVGVVWLTTLMLKGSGNVLMVFWLVAGALSSFIYGVQLLVMAITGFSQYDADAPWTYLVMPQQRNCVLVGFTLILASFLIVGWTLSNWKLLGQSLQLLETARSLMKTMPAATGLNLLLQIIAAFTAFLTVFGFLMIQGKLTYNDAPTTMSLNPNGGLALMPLERKSISGWSGLWSSTLLVVACVWVLESLFTLTKYATLYTGIVWYFSPIDHLGHRRTSANLPLFGMMLGLHSHLGSVALFSWFAWVSRPMRVLFLSSAPRMQNNSLDSQLTEEERDPAVRGETLAHRFSDIIHNGVICETVANSRGIWPAFRTTRRRVNRSLAAQGSLQHLAASALSLPSLILWSIMSGVMMTTFAIASSVLVDLTSASHQAPSALFFSTPFISAAIISLIVGYVASIPLTSMTALMDSLLYCVVLEKGKAEPGDSLSLRPTNNINPYSDGAELGKQQCPDILQDRLESMAQQDNLRLTTASDE